MLQDVQALTAFRQSAHEGDKVVSPTHQPPLLPREDHWYSFLLQAQSTRGPECKIIHTHSLHTQSTISIADATYIQKDAHTLLFNVII
jgi:hypothetical protein